MGAPMVEKHQLVDMWLDLSPEEKFSQGLPLDRTKLRRHLGIGTTVLRDWEKRHWANKLGENLETAGDPEPEDDFNLQEWLKETNRERWESINRSAKSGNPASQRLLALAAGEIEKKEIKETNELSADDIARRNLEAERQLSEAGY